ncbi:hypothetical protein [Streptomyces mayteni]
MGDGGRQPGPVAGALRRALRTAAWLAPLVFAVVTAGVLLLTNGGASDGMNHPPDPGTTTSPTEAGVPGTSVGGEGDGESNGPLDGLGSAAGLGAGAALVTALGTAASRVLVAMGQFRLANANAEAIRAGRPPAPAQDPGEGPEGDGPP